MKRALYYPPRGFWNGLILRVTHRIWNRRISSVLSSAYQAGNINSEQLHVLLSYFDPTQKHLVYRQEIKP